MLVRPAHSFWPGLSPLPAGYRGCWYGRWMARVRPRSHHPPGLACDGGPGGCGRPERGPQCGGPPRAAYLPRGVCPAHPTGQNSMLVPPGELSGTAGAGSSRDQAACLDDERGGVLGGLGGDLGQHRGVGVSRQDDARVAEHVLDDFQLCPGGEGEAGRAVPEIMQPGPAAAPPQRTAAGKPGTAGRGPSGHRRGR